MTEDTARDASVSDQPVVRLELVDEIAVITLDSQHNRNALSQRLVAELDAAITDAESADARAIVLRHEGPAFCAGADLKERSSGSASARDGAPFVSVMSRLMDTARPTIAAVNGAVRAGGIGLMASCDLVVVDQAVSFALTEVRIGVAPAMISVPILRRVQPSQIAAAFLTGENFDAHEARSIGLITHVTDDVDATVAALTHGIRCGAKRAVAETKVLMATVPRLDRDTAFAQMTELSNELFASDDAAEGMAAFREKRRPAWHPDAASSTGDAAPSASTASSGGTSSSDSGDDSGDDTGNDAGSRYRRARLAFVELVQDLDDQHLDLPVPACPGWSVRDVTAHLAGVAVDAVAGVRPGDDMDAWTASHVSSRAGRSLQTLLDEWADAAASLEPTLADWPDAFPAYTLDLLCHEQDVRSAIGRPGRRDTPDLAEVIDGLVTRLGVVAQRAGLDPITVVTTDAAEVPDTAGVRFEADGYEFFRASFGRRSRAQLLSRLRGANDPEAYVPVISIFGPAEADLIE